MKLIMTIMVRDEADVIEPMLKFHLEQGIDFFIVTDNGSVDGTREILEKFAHKGVLELRLDPVHAKQQGRTVTAMARDAYLIYGADWVINADADEFWMPVDPKRTLKQVFSNYKSTWNSFTVNVTDMIGPPAVSGSGLDRLQFEDKRTVEELLAVGLRGHSTHDAVHVGSAEVTVSQGNHFVSLESHGRPNPEDDLRVFHFQWRSWEQFKRKVVNSGRAYEQSSDLIPSPNHHGMLDFKRWKEGTLEAWYVARHPQASELGGSKFPAVNMPRLSRGQERDRLYAGARESELRTFGSALARLWAELSQTQLVVQEAEKLSELVRAQEKQILDLDKSVSDLNSTLKNPLKIVAWWFRAGAKRFIRRD